MKNWNGFFEKPKITEKVAGDGLFLKHKIYSFAPTRREASSVSRLGFLKGLSDKFSFNYNPNILKFFR